MIGYCKLDEDELYKYANENGIKLTRVIHDPDGSQMKYIMNGFGYQKDLLVYDWKDISFTYIGFWYIWYRLGILKIKLTVVKMPKENEQTKYFREFAEYCVRQDRSTRYAHVTEKKKSRSKYNVAAECYGYMTFKGELVPEPKEASNVKRVFELKKLKLTRYQICKAMNDEGRRYRNHQKWKEHYIKSLNEKRRFYAGYVNKDGVWEKGTHKPLIGEEWMN